MSAFRIEPARPEVGCWDAVVFDCDGVLVDSEAISCGILAEMLTSIGLPYTQEEIIETFTGRSMETCMKMIEAQLGRSTPDDFAAEFERRTFAAFEQDLRPVAGVEAVLDALPWPTCIASSGSHLKLRTTLQKTGLYPRFEGRIFSATDVRRGKPYPDMFLHAAERMGAEPDRCAVVEDSVLGVEAGCAAGMTVFGYAGTTTAEKLSTAGAIVFHDMAVLPELLETYAPGFDQPPLSRAIP